LAEAKVSSAQSYADLRRDVSAALFEGRKRLEVLKIQIYWDTGNLIHQYLKPRDQTFEFGKRIIQKLSQDLGIDKSLLYRMFKFAKYFQNVARGPHLTWSH
jgi:hypothetical protein